MKAYIDLTLRYHGAASGGNFAEAAFGLDYDEGARGGDQVVCCSIGESLDLAEEHVRHLDFGAEMTTTGGVTVLLRAWRLGDDEGGDDSFEAAVLAGRDIQLHLVTVLPREPKCVEDEDHVWRPDSEIGDDDNAGVCGAPGGTLYITRCERCGAEKREFTALNPNSRPLCWTRYRYVRNLSILTSGD